MTQEEIKQLLEEKYLEYCQPHFIELDPISIPHLFEERKDIEISGLIAATIAWGQRPTIIKNANSAMQRMGNEPFRFVMEYSENDLKALDGFVHRTFNSEDLKHFVRSLRNIYSTYDSLEGVFLEGIGNEDKNMLQSITHFKQVFFGIPHQKRTQKHVSDPLQGSASKRLNMFLRWLVRPNDQGVDFGLWKRIPTSILSCPLDVHSGRNARQLGLLHRTQNDWRAVEELDASLRLFDPNDPVKYDFALFGMGVFPD
ncbi:MAG: TIGR02757 family protein [Flavobacteriales bacterium]|nr:TIGR02757 family protein [Flavobacteriales bacterium]